MAVTFGLHAAPRTDGAGVPLGPATLDRYRRALEVVGPEFTTLWVSDHLDVGEEPLLECWTLLSYLAATFPDRRVGSLVIGQGYRNPALLAKMAATLQVLSDGRLLLGLGAGWAEREYRSYGFDFPSPRVRVDQLAEAVHILRLLWQGGPATFAGEHYSITDARCLPVPATPIPILIGSDGHRMVRYSAAHADAWNWDGSPDLFDRPFAELRARLEELGRPLADIEVTASFQVSFPADASDFVGRYPSSYPGYDEVVLGPTPDDAIEPIARLVAAGVTHFQIAVDDLDTLSLFAREVASSFAAPAP
jgi:alkanesulfonate monooxygenase SsuD/methylene tetrahydromethanopterin reductase-like flavin-dependent oxidoreductase (luciferase family)